MTGLVELALRQADPANVLIVAWVWWRLDRRLRQVREELRRIDPGETPGSGVGSD